MTMSRPSDIVAIALAEVGYREKASNAYLDDKTANAGSGNWTKYARDLAKAGYYQANKNGYAWCDVFTDWCFFKAYGPVEGQRIQCQTGPLGAGCIYSAQYYREKGRYDNTPKVGDQVFFQSGGTIGHTGIVVEVTATTITTVEGNSSDQVKKNTYSRTSSYIAGYGHALYDGEDTAEIPPEEPEEEPAASEPAVPEPAVSVTLNQLSVGSKGGQVKTVQRIIYARGINPDIAVDGDFGPVTKGGVMLLQKQLFPGKPAEWDGVVGQKTWQAALTQLI
jgi:hypothetical protein